MNKIEFDNEMDRYKMIQKYNQTEVDSMIENENRYEENEIGMIRL